MAGAEPLYRADLLQLAREVELEGLTILFHRRSGMTHVLAPPAPQILDALQTEAGLAELRLRIVARFDLEGDEAALASRVEELVSAGLVERR